MAQISRGIIFEYDNQAEAEQISTSQGGGKVYRLEDEWWIVLWEDERSSSEVEKDTN